MKKVFIESEYIKLDQLLKFAEIADSGGFAKLIIAEEYVLVNGKVCTQRGKKIAHDDMVEINLPTDDGDVEKFKLKIIKKG